MCRLSELVYYHPYCIVLLHCPWQVSHKVHRDMFPLPFCYLKWLEQPHCPLVLCLYLLARERPSNEIPNVSLHPAPIILATNIMVHFRATWMRCKPRAMELPEDLLSQISQLGNCTPSPILKNTLCVNGPALVTCT